MALPFCSYQGCREYVEHIDGYCPIHDPPKYDGTAQSAQRIERHWASVETAESIRAARIARVDETAREYAVAASGRHTTWCHYEARKDEPMRLVAEPAFFKAAYEFALALERARGEAIKEIQ